MSVSQVVSTARPVDASRGRILRYTLAERVNHWIAGLSYIYCLLTGLAFWSPYMVWFADIVGGGPTARFWHPWLGLVFFGSVLVMYKQWRNDMVATDPTAPGGRTYSTTFATKTTNCLPLADSTTVKSSSSGSCSMERFC